MTLQAYMQSLYAQLGLTGPPVLTKEGSYQLVLDEGIEVFLHTYPIFQDDPHEIGIALSAIITACNEEGSGGLYQAALLGDLFGVATGRAVIGLSASGKNLTLCREIEYNPEYTDFKDILEEFINTVDIWRETAKTYQPTKA